MESSLQGNGALFTVHASWMFIKLTSMVVKYITRRDHFIQIYKTLIISNDSRHLRGCGHFGIIVALMMHVHIELGEANKHLDLMPARFLSEAAQMSPISTPTIIDYK
jgi:hypothetical protein